MYEAFGARQLGNDETGGKVQFSLFFPDTNRDPLQYERGGDPRIKNIRIVGDFQNSIDGKGNWNKDTAPLMVKKEHPKGWVWAYITEKILPAGFYQYKYLVTFDDGEERPPIGDPCTKYGGSKDQNSAIAVGGRIEKVKPLKNPRKRYRDLVVYEMNVDDFTAEFRGHRSPLEAMRDKLNHLQELGIDAIHFMPLLAWWGDRYSWGYDQYRYFAIEYNYVHKHDEPADKIFWLEKLINDCHERDIHVIFDGVFNHVGALDKKIFQGFTYPWFYKNPYECPYIGDFGGTFPGLQDLDFRNNCTEEFIRDVCFYWIDSFKIDGFRLDNTTNYWIPENKHGLPNLLEAIHNHTDADQTNFSLTLEFIDIQAANVTNSTTATSYWNNALYECCFKYLWDWKIDSPIMRALDNHAWLNSNKVATTYLSTHDHSHITWQAGARDNVGSMQWYRTQPWAIALFTCSGVPLIQNGQEFGEEHWIMEDDHDSNRRVKPRPLRWDFTKDYIGSWLITFYKKLIAIRKNYPSLCSNNFYPTNYEDWQKNFNSAGYGVDVDRGIVIYHRWGNSNTNQLQRFIIVLNFSPTVQTVSVPFSTNGQWIDLLNDLKVNVNNYWLPNLSVNSNWGHIFMKET